MSLTQQTERPALFRTEALDAQQSNWLGEIILIRPLSFDIITALCTVVSLALVLFLVFGTYTKRATVSGQLMPDKGLAKIYPMQPGIVVGRYVKEGQFVLKGQVLFKISADRRYSAQRDVQAAISELVTSRLANLQDELSRTKALQDKETASLEDKVSALEGQLSGIVNSITLQKQRVALAQDEDRRYKALLVQNFISREDYEQKQADLLDQRYRLESLQGQRASTAGDLSTAKVALQSASLKDANEISQLQREADSTSQELAESEGKASFLITATETGTATAITADPGQNVDGTQPLVSIVPQGSHLVAHLYAPSSAIGFVKVGDSVLLRYQAYPYQKFGAHHGTISAISDVALTSAELTGINVPSPTSGEPLYRITVRLHSQDITAYGHQAALEPGMQLSADILQDTRHLYEWALEPLYSISGRL